MLHKNLIKPANLRIVELESVRGLAAIAVVFFHLPKWNLFLNQVFINNGYLMVQLFFVLSGFVMFSSYDGKIRSGSDFFKFQILRLGRLYPVHFIFLMAFLAIEIAKYVAINKFGMHNIRGIPFSENGFEAFCEQIFLIHAIGPTGNSLTFNSPSWSISVEFYTYIIFAFINLYLYRFRCGFYCIVVFLGILVLFFFPGAGFTGFCQCLIGFFCGCLTAYLLNMPWLYKSNVYLVATALISLCLFVCFKNDPNLDFLIYPISIFLIFAIVSSPDNFIKKTMRFRFFVWIGELSYSIYMAHFLVLWIVANIAKRIFRKPEVLSSSGEWVLSLSVTETIAAVVFSLALVFIVSQAIFSFVEKPFRDRTRKLVAKIIA